MKQLRHVLALTLVFCMVFGMVTPSLAVSGEISVEEDNGIPVEEDEGIEIEVDDRGFDIDEDREETSVLPKQDETADETNTTGKVEGYKYNIIHLDCGRKYFSVDSIKQIIDNASAAGFNYIQLAVGNDGMRFLLDDMSLTVNGTTYTSDAVKAAIQKGNTDYNATFKGASDDNGSHKTYNPSVNELSQDDMDAIIAHAQSKSMGVIPLINTPGHMDAILAAATSLTNTDCSYDSSVRTIDVTNSTAVAFTKAFLNKYIDYFAGKGCTLFNMGADEYANDTGSPRFSDLQSGNGNGYKKYIEYVNAVATDITNAGMTPMAFNDGIYYNSKTSYGTFNENIIVMYWSNGWSGYSLMTASNLVANNNNRKLINTNGSYYWVIGKTNSQCSATKAEEFSYTTFPLYYYGNFTTEEVTSNVVGSTFCIWSDYPGDETEADVVSKTAATIAAFKNSLPTVDKVTETPTTPTDPTEPTVEEKTVTVSVKQTVTETQNGVNNENNVDDSELNTDYAVATVVVDGTDAVEGGDTYTPTSVAYSNLTNGYKNKQWVKTNYYYPDSNGKYYPVYAQRTGNNSNRKYSYGYSKTDNANNVTTVDNNGSSNTIVTVYEKSTTAATPAKTTIAITGVAVGTTYITVGNVRYTINVIAEDLTKVTPITVEYWITNSRIPDANGNTSLTITAQQAYGEDGLVVADLVPATANKDKRTQEFWQTKILDVELENKSKSGTELQAEMNGDDETLHGSTFTKIRYNGKWQVYTTEWIDVDCTIVSVTYTGDNSKSVTYTGDKNQLVAYYMEVVDISNDEGKSELHVSAADWGTKGDSTGSWGYKPESNRCSVSVQIVYEDGETNPSYNTAEYLKSKTFVYNYWSGGRGLGTMIFDGEGSYQIYKVTAATGTMKSSTDDTAYTVNVTSLTWTNNEETVWEGEATDTVGISNPASYPSYEEPYDNLTWNTSAYNKNNAILIRVYVKAVATEDSLLVRYIDKATGSVFYDYNITVKENTIFDANIGLDEEKQEVLNGSVENYYGNTQKISAELSEMSEIGASFKNGKYKCVEVKRVSDKIVELYYEFNNVMDFVVDFGVPLHLSPRDIGIPDDQRTWIKASVSGATQGKATIGVGEGLTYTPTEIMTEPELLSVGLTETNDATSSYQIRLYPATNVLYEEGVLTQAETTNSYVDWTRTTGISTKQQTVEKLGAENVHGYDSAYDKDTTFSADSYYHATLSETNKFTKNLTFTFTGTGFDVISECGPQTGALVVAVKNSAGKTVEVAVVDTLFNGDSKYITGTSGILDYQVPVYRNLGLEYGTYTVNIGSAYVANRPTDAASVASLHSNDTYSIVSDILDAFGYDDFNVEDVELVYTDENSVLNGGTGVVSEKAVTAYSANLAEEYAAEPYANSTTQDVYVDGVRIYGTLANDPGYATAEADVKYDSVYEFAKNSAVDLDDYIENALIYVEYDGDQPVYNIADYKQQGPENEVYLTPSSGIAFELSGYTEGDTVQVSLKAINGAVSVENALPANGSIPETSTEMYYTVEPKKMEDESGRWYVLIVNSNNSKGILSISNLKISDGINVVITPELKDYILNKDDVAEFIPETFTAKAPLNLQQTHNSTISISTSTDANCVKVIIGDEVVKLTPNNKKAVSRGKAKLYTYNYALFGYNLSAGKNVFKLVAVSADTGKESAPIEVTVTVTE